MIMGVSEEQQTAHTVPSRSHEHEIDNQNNDENIPELQEDWGEEYNDMVTFLCGLHLNQYAEMFVNQGISVDIFLNLNEEDLCHIGMTNSEHRAVLLAGISHLSKNKTKPLQEVSVKELKDEEVNTILDNSGKHVSVMHAALANLRLNLQKSGVHNSLITDTLSSAELLEQLAQEADIQAQLVTNQINALLSKKPGSVSNDSRLRWFFKLTVISSIGILCGLLYTKRGLSTKCT